MNALSRRRQSWPRAIHPSIAMLLTVVALGLGDLRVRAAPQAQPTVVLIPDHGSCDPPTATLAVRGQGFPAGIAVNMNVVLPNLDNSPRGDEVGVGRGSVDVDGSLTGMVKIAQCGPETPVGLRFRVTLYEGTRPVIGPFLGEAAFTVARSPASSTSEATTPTSRPAAATAPPAARLPITGSAGTPAVPTAVVTALLGAAAILGASAFAFFRFGHHR